MSKPKNRSYFGLPVVFSPVDEGKGKHPFLWFGGNLVLYACTLEFLNELIVIPYLNNFKV